MKINSIDDLKKIREDYQDIVNLRQNNKNTKDKVEILIGMSTCGISAGAKETYNAFIDELNKQGLNNIKVIPVGCVGYCHSEPTVQVNISGQEPVIYGNVKKDKVHDIIEKHIKGGNLAEDLVLNVDFERA